ncbi:hypothetical protein M9H77_01946 [Catharanthus roseus]|uniref:Uncharacterized protein n=1 Tax=Catharanthus roseus TaxID=4058 RepID=A0ACC0C700_CATRO|nr:hypothetical protein M9H77_01946 [Catharanthus roseus]
MSIIHRSIKGLHCTWLVSRTMASSDDVDVFTLTLHHALRWVARLVESQEGLETKVRLQADLVGAPGICSLVWPVIWRVWLLWNRALIRCLVGIDYNMPELVSNDLIMRSRLCPWSPTVALHFLLNSGVEAKLMCLDSLRLPSCIRTSHTGVNQHVPQEYVPHHVARGFHHELSNYDNKARILTAKDVFS